MAVLPFRALMSLDGPSCLAGHTYRAALRLLRNPVVLTQAHASPIWQEAVRWALHHADSRYERCALRVVAIQPDVTAGRRSPQQAEIQVLSAPARRFVHYDDHPAGAASAPADLANPDELIDRAGYSLADQLETLTGITLTEAARDYLLRLWRAYARALAADPGRLGSNGLAGLTGHQQVKERKSLRPSAWGQAVPIGVNRIQQHAGRRLLLGTPTRPGWLVWTAQGLTPAAAASHPQLVATWAVAMVELDPIVATAPEADRHRWRTAINRWGRARCNSACTGQLPLPADPPLDPHRLAAS